MRAHIEEDDENKLCSATLNKQQNSAIAEAKKADTLYTTELLHTPA
jgi:hypothetical protein